MAKHTIVSLVDDSTGNTIPEGQALLITVAVDGKNPRDFDLSEATTRELTVADLIALVGRKSDSLSRGGSSTPGTTAPRTTDREYNQTVRAWAKAQGRTVSERGRIPRDLIDDYEARNTVTTRPVDKSGHSADTCEDLDACPVHGTAGKPSESPAEAEAGGDQGPDLDDEERAAVAWAEGIGRAIQLKKDGHPHPFLMKSYRKAVRDAEAVEATG